MGRVTNEKQYARRTYGIDKVLSGDKFPRTCRFGFTRKTRLIHLNIPFVVIK